MLTYGVWCWGFYCVKHSFSVCWWKFQLARCMSWGRHGILGGTVGSILRLVCHVSFFAVWNMHHIHP